MPRKAGDCEKNSLRNIAKPAIKEKKMYAEEQNCQEKGHFNKSRITLQDKSGKDPLKNVQNRETISIRCPSDVHPMSIPPPGGILGSVVSTATWSTSGAGAGAGAESDAEPGRKAQEKQVPQHANHCKKTMLQRMIQLMCMSVYHHVLS